MASITKEELRAEIVAQLDDADLNSVSAKKVRQALEKKFDEDLSDRKKEIDDLINEVLNEKGSGGEEEDEEEEEEEEKKPAPKKRKAAPKKDASDSEGEPSDDDDDEEEYAPKKKRGAPKKRAKKSDSDEEDWRASKKTAKKGGGAKKGGTGYTKKCKLSEPLAKLMGEERMARHEVIKKMWALIKENNMYDPKNKQYAICDDAMLSVIGVKRFRTFGMMKYLKDHFTNE